MFEDFDRGTRDVVIKCIAKAGAHEENTFAGGSLEKAGHESFRKSVSLYDTFAEGSGSTGKDNREYER